MKKVVFLTLFISHGLLAETPCVQGIGLHEDIENWVSQLNQFPAINCAELPRPMTKSQAKELLKLLATKQKLSLGANSSEMSRHQIGKQLNDCQARPGQKAFVLNFEGTGSFSPRTSDLMKKFADCSGDGNLAKSFHYHAIQTIKEVYGNDEKWSALQAGPLNQLASLDATAQMGWVSFASEETEILADPSSLNSYTSTAGSLFPRGIYQAIDCIQEYSQSAKALGIDPKIIVQGHSSGARSAVKFSEKLKTFSPPLEIDLMLTIDPVKEAHLAVAEVTSQMAGNANRSIYNSIPFVDDVEIKPPNVWTRRQPDTLYKPSNVDRSVNVYQNIDSEGLKGPLKFGIHGSPIDGADINQFLKEDLGSDAHGEITRHQKTQMLISSEYQKLGLIP